MNIISYIHPIRTYLPCTGAGRFMNNSLLGLANQSQVKLELLFASQWLQADGHLPANCPLRLLTKQNFPMPENATERTWKLFSYPRMDDYIPSGTDWLFAPMETYIPVTKCPVAITIFDIQAFEPDLPWSHTWQHRLFRLKWGQWVRRALRDYRIIFTISQFSKQRMVDLLGADPRKVVVVGVGVEPAYFEMATIDPTRLRRTVETPYTLIIGGLRQKKGADYILAAAEALQKRKSSLQIVVAGDSEANYVEAAKTYPNITLLGLVEDEDLPRILRGATSLLFLSHYEGFGIPAVEAMAAGIPAVVSNRASLPEIVGDAGIIVEPDNAAEVADILINLERDTDLRSTYTQRGLAHAQQYTWPRIVTRLTTALEQYA
ncbi:MAG: glycosyltransferase family 4 protein [Anaerolineae bacterium]|nr:glycosyltransferase family 4 protein [Anaerolineae bacterium]